MAIVAECPNCGKRFKASEAQHGRKARCSGCAQTFVIGGTAAAGAAKMPGALPSSAPTQSRPRVTPPQKTAASHAAVRNVGRAAAGSSAPQPQALVAGSPRTRAALPGAAPRAGAMTLAAGSDAPHEKPAPAAPEVSSPIAPKRDLVDELVAPLRAGAQAELELPPRPLPPRAAQTAGQLVAKKETAPRSSPAKLPRRRAAVLAVSSVLLLIGGAVAAWQYAWPLRRAQQATSSSRSDAVPSSGAAIAQAPPDLPGAWSVRVDAPLPARAIAEDLRLAIPGIAGQRYAAASIILAQRAPRLAVRSTSEGEQARAQVEVWDFENKTRIAAIDCEAALQHLVISPDGRYIAGQWYDEGHRSMRAAIYSVEKAAPVYQHALAAGAPLSFGMVAGFPGHERAAVLAERLRIIDLASGKVTDELSTPPWSEDTRVTASTGARLLAIADSRTVHLVDLAEKRVLGPAAIPDTVIAHPRRRLVLRAAAFSPDQAELALLLDNRQSARRIAVLDVASGRLKKVYAPQAPIYSGGPELQWTRDQSAFLVGGGILLDRQTSRQVGQIYGDRPDEGLGGVLAGMIDSERALIAWDKHPGPLVIRSIDVRREKPQWVRVTISSATVRAFNQIQCVAREFGNNAANASLLQTGRLLDGSRFLVVDVTMEASLAEDAPDWVTFRTDQFALLADGQPRPAIGTLTSDGIFSLERPEYDLRRGESLRRQRSIVFTVSGQERTLTLSVGTAQKSLEIPGKMEIPAVATLVPPIVEQLPPSIYSAADDRSAVEVKVISAPVGPVEVDPDSAEHIPLRVTYSSPTAWLMAVNFDMRANAPRVYQRGSRPPESPRFGLLLPDGTHIRPVVELPGPLPAMMATGERCTHTCLFMVLADPSRARGFRLTCDNSPVSTLKAESSTASRAAP